MDRRFRYVPDIDRPLPLAALVVGAVTHAIAAGRDVPPLAALLLGMTLVVCVVAIVRR